MLKYCNIYFRSIGCRLHHPYIYIPLSIINGIWVSRILARYGYVASGVGFVSHSSMMFIVSFVDKIV